jgi:hypothetical protein
MHASDPEAYHAVQRKYPTAGHVLTDDKSREVVLDESTDREVYQRWLGQQWS